MPHIQDSKTHCGTEDHNTFIVSNPTTSTKSRESNTGKCTDGIVTHFSAQQPLASFKERR